MKGSGHMGKTDWPLVSVEIRTTLTDLIQSWKSHRTNSKSVQKVSKSPISAHRTYTKQVKWSNDSLISRDVQFV